jgi:valyl-tRNA synthetase
MLKVKIQLKPEYAHNSVRKAVAVYEDILKVLHPVIPFVTEELWHLMEEGRGDRSISFEPLPKKDISSADRAAEQNFERIAALITSIRNVRANNELPFSKKIRAFFKPFDPGNESLLNAMKGYIERICNLEFTDELQVIDGLVTAEIISEGFEAKIYFEGNELDAKQTEKLRKELENLSIYIVTLTKKLGNENFITKASAEVVQKEKDKKREAEEKLNKLRAILGMD